jgi:hypothetical protein
VDTFERVGTARLRFTPDDRADGVRWDNRLNWTPRTDTDQRRQRRSGRQLGGSAAPPRSTTSTWAMAARLTSRQGKLSVNGELTGGTDGAADRVDAGQLWVED